MSSSAANGKHKGWDDAFTVFDTSPDIYVPLLVIGTKQDLGLFFIQDVQKVNSNFELLMVDGFYWVPPLTTIND